MRARMKCVILNDLNDLILVNDVLVKIAKANTRFLKTLLRKLKAESFNFSEDKAAPLSIK